MHTFISILNKFWCIISKSIFVSYFIYIIHLGISGVYCHPNDKKCLESLNHGQPTLDSKMPTDKDETTLNDKNNQDLDEDIDKSTSELLNIHLNSNGRLRHRDAVFS